MITLSVISVLKLPLSTSSMNLYDIVALKCNLEKLKRTPGSGLVSAEGQKESAPLCKDSVPEPPWKEVRTNEHFRSLHMWCQVIVCIRISWKSG